MRVEKTDEPFPIVPCSTACAKHQNTFQVYSFLSLVLLYHVSHLKLGIYAWNVQLKDNDVTCITLADDRSSGGLFVIA
jgi:hypothetical protein